jgi:hypothetical protein
VRRYRPSGRQADGASVTFDAEDGLCGQGAEEASRQADNRSASVAVDSLVSLKAERPKAERLSAPVFCTRTGNYLNKSNVLRAFRAVVARVNEKLTGQEGAKIDSRNNPFS